MAVELEKIASLLEEANRRIAELETEKETLLNKVKKAEEELSLSKEAADKAFAYEYNTNFGSVSSETPFEYKDSESRLDSFLED